MTDKELLEKAARAAGVELIDYCTSVAICFYSKRTQSPWNPLARDGDALRLAVTLDLNIFPTDLPGRVLVEDGGDIMAGESHGDDKCASTRRAIVRAAADMADRKTPNVGAEQHAPR